MDEIDSIGSSRIESGSGGDSEVQRTMLELLNQLDGFEATKNIKVIMATNRIDILDPALLRPGRIDRKIEFPPPNEEARLDILKIHSRKMNLTRGINLRKIAELMPGASGAEVKVYIAFFDFNMILLGFCWIFVVLGSLYGSRYVRVEGKESARYAGRFRNGRRQSHAKGFRKEYVDQETMEISLCISFRLYDFF